MKSSRTSRYGLRRYPLIERRQLAFMRVSECQQITVSNMRRVQQAGRVHLRRIQQGNVIRPKNMSGQFCERGQQLGDRGWRAGAVRISRMTDNTKNAIFSQRTSCPGAVARSGEPQMRAVVQQVTGIDQGNQNVYVEEELGQDNSSRSCCTKSDVTRGAPLRTLRRGTPFRVLALVSSGASARLAKEEITSPTDFLSTAAISLAALRTSSSITSVVRITCVITHHTSDARRYATIDASGFSKIGEELERNL